MAKVISITNNSETSCKTTSALNLAGSFALCEKKTLLIDCSPQCDATKKITIKEKKFSYGLSSFLQNKNKAIDVVFNTDLKYLNFIPAQADLSRIKTSISGLNSLIYSIKKNYDYIIIDTPILKFPIASSAIAVSDYAIIPMQCKKKSIEDLFDTLKTIQAIKKIHNINIEIAGFLFTLCKNHKEIKKFFTKEYLEVFKDKIFQTTIPIDDVLKNNNFASLIDMEAEGTKAYFDLAFEMLAHIETSE